MITEWLDAMRKQLETLELHEVGLFWGGIPVGGLLLIAGIWRVWERVSKLHIPYGQVAFIPITLLASLVAVAFSFVTAGFYVLLGMGGVGVVVLLGFLAMIGLDRYYCRFFEGW